jgi:hypothetical protein
MVSLNIYEYGVLKNFPPLPNIVKSFVNEWLKGVKSFNSIEGPKLFGDLVFFYIPS